MDADLYLATNRLTDHTTWLHGPMIAYARYGIVLFALALLAGWWVSRAANDLEALAGAAWASAAAIVALGAGQLIGNIVDRARPYETIPQTHVLIARTTDFSFPSDDATAAAAVAAGLVLATRRIGLIAASAALLMAFARVYVGAHYRPTSLRASCSALASPLSATTSPSPTSPGCSAISQPHPCAPSDCLASPAHAVVNDPDQTPHVTSSPDALLAQVLREEWPHQKVLAALPDWAEPLSGSCCCEVLADQAFSGW